MTNLLINDLAASKELDNKAMAGVYGGKLTDNIEFLSEILEGFGFFLGSPLTVSDPDNNVIGITQNTEQVGITDRGNVNNVSLQFASAIINS